MIGILLGTVLLSGILLLLTAVVLTVRRMLVPVRPVTVGLNGGAGFESTTGVKLLDALASHGILLPAACGGAGTCGLCRVRVTDGATAPLPSEADRLSRAELRQGVHLACQVVLRGDVAVEVPEALLSADSYACKVVSARFLTPLIREVVLALPEGRAPTFEAGAFVQISAPPFELAFTDIEVPSVFSGAWSHLRGLSVGSADPVTRAYSIANRPQDSAAGHIVLDIRLALPPPAPAGAPPGIVSSFLFAVQPGQVLTVGGPFGSFRAQESGREMVFVGGGVGLAPLRAIIHDQLERIGTERKISLWYGARSQADLFYAEELDALAGRHPNFTWTVVLSDPSPDAPWDGRTGFVHSALRQDFLQENPAPDLCEFYLCGPPLMIQAVMMVLQEAGVEPDSIFNDDFGS